MIHAKYFSLVNNAPQHVQQHYISVLWFYNVFIFQKQNTCFLLQINTRLQLQWNKTSRYCRCQEIILKPKDLHALMSQINWYTESWENFQRKQKQIYAQFCLCGQKSFAHVVYKNIKVVWYNQARKKENPPNLIKYTFYQWHWTMTKFKPMMKTNPLLI